MKVLPINAGYYNVKSIDNNIFKTRIEKSFSDMQSTADIIEYEGITYIVGEGEVNIDLDKTQTDFVKICILNMCARFTMDTEQFKLVITTPPLLYPEQSKELPKYLIGKYKITHNNKSKSIDILDVKVFPETITAYLCNNVNNKYANKNVLVLDIGGLTTNGVLLHNGNFTMNDIFTDANGMYNIDYKISQYINKKYYMTTSVDDIQYFRDNGLYIKGDKENTMIKEIEYIDELYCAHIQNIVQLCGFKKWAIDGYEVLITGGGGKILYPIITDFYIPHAKLSNDPIFDNLNGLRLLAKKVYSV